MAGFDAKVNLDGAHHEEAKKFINFLKKLGKSHGVSIKYRRKGSEIVIIIDGTPGGKVDALLQELILNRGLYYYSLSVTSTNVIRKVITPIYKALIEERFDYPNSQHLSKHLSGKLGQNDFVPTDLNYPASYEYEILFRKWDIGSMSDWDFVKDTDSMLTRFMLQELDHEPGTRSPKFDMLLKNTYLKGLAMDKDVRRLFARLHKARTEGLHRQTPLLTKEEITSLALRLYLYFTYLDEFKNSQLLRKSRLSGKWYKRVPYGEEKWDFLSTEEFASVIKHPCHDCAAIKGQFHVEGCDVEQCPRCLGQSLSCDCRSDEDIEYQFGE